VPSADQMSEASSTVPSLASLNANIEALRRELGELASALGRRADGLTDAISQIAPALQTSIDDLRSSVAPIAPSLHTHLDDVRGDVAQMAPSLHRHIDDLRAYLDDRLVSGRGGFMASLSERERAIVAAVQSYTMLSLPRIIAFRDAVMYVERERIPGAIVECGVWRGGAMMAAALTALEVGPGTRDLYLFDTFEGMPPPADVDRDAAGVRAAELLAQADKDTSWLWAYASLDDVRANLETTGYPPQRLHYVKGRVEETVPREAPEKIAVLRLDTDWYESTKHELTHLVPRLMPNAVLIIDDVGDWAGSRQAVEEFLDMTDRPILFSRTDHTGRMGVVPASPVDAGTHR